VRLKPSEVASPANIRAVSVALHLPPKGSMARVVATLGALLVIASCVGASSPSVPSATPDASAGNPSSQPGPSGSLSTGPGASSSAQPETARWVRLPTIGTSPPAREDHTWTVDQAGRYAYLFGGRDGSRVFGDLWRYGLASGRWTKLSSGASPAPRFGHTGTWVEGRGLVIWSGQSGAAFFNDLWLYRPNDNRWTRLPGNGAAPLARYGSCAALGPDGRLWISHGFTHDAGRFSDTRAYDFGTGRWSDETPTGAVPVIRCLHDCLWSPDGRLLIYGGQTTGVAAIGDLWSLGGPSGGAAGGWRREPMPPLPPRNLYALTEIGEHAYVFGGTPLSGMKLADLWRLDLPSGIWSEVRGGDGPSGRSGATLVADRARSRLVLFGGLTDGGAASDAWELRLAG
jgi:galactose oxidase-like protein